ncbi:hypothetical protein ACFQ34_33920 [Pseudonocardia benzenivorans]|uniref:Uncharacterized protein n=1 Tax=Pseudonocardia benzenivorans TaxID=228005 RepID=A0ABW3VSY9_9PSEU
MTSDAVETAAQLIHNTHHRAGTAGVCGECRGLARQVADVVAGPARTQWAVRWEGATPSEETIEVCVTEDQARRIASSYSGASVIRSESRTIATPWRSA